MTTSENHLDPKEPKWFAVYTSYKREKLVQKMLLSKGIECYLPLQKVTKKYTRKIRVTESPLINCYVFVKIVKGQYVSVLETEHVLKFTKIAQNLLSIPESEIITLRKVVGEGLEIEVRPTTLSEGDEIEIVAGNLVGLKGRLITHDGKNKVVIDLDRLGYSLRMNIDVSLLRKI